MVRLLYLLIRQRLHRARKDGTDSVAHARWPAIVVGTGVLALSLGVGAYALLGERPMRAAPRAGPPAKTATLQLLVARVDSVPLLVYLEAPGAAVPAGDKQAPQTVHLTSINSAFEPAFQVASGAARVEVGNADPIAHNTHVFDGRRTLFNVAMPLQGVPVTKVLGRAGLFEVRCDLHPWMRAAVFVPSNAHHAVIREPGEFVLHGIAPGSYRVIVWSPGHAKTMHAVELAPGAMQSLALAAH